MTWRDHKPLLRYRIISGLSCFVLVCTFVLFLLVGLSLPIIKPVYLLVVRSTAPQNVPTSIATELRFGVWGMCTSSAREENVACIGPQLGYDVPEYLVALSGLPPVVIQAVQHSLLVVLILHPIATGLVFLAAFASLFLGSHAFSIFVLVLTIIAAILATVVLGVDLALVLTAKNQLATLGREVEILFGNGVWIMVVAVALVWLAVILLSARACYCCGVRRHHHHHHHHDERY